MKQLSICIVLIFLPLINNISIFAQNKPEQITPGLLYFFVKDDQNEEITQIFRQTQDQGFHDTQIPHFIIADHLHKYILGIGGYIFLTSSFDFNGICNNNDFIPYYIPVIKTNEDSKQYQIGAENSRIFLKLAGKTPRLGILITYIETDFRGPGSSLALRQGYLKICGLTFGQTWSSFNNPAASPPTVDYTGPNAYPDMMNVMIRYQHYFRNGLELAISAEQPKLSATYSDFTIPIPQRTPDIAAYAQYNIGNKSLIRISGVLRDLAYQNVVLKKNTSQIGWGVQMSGKLNMFNNFTLYFNGEYGKGITRYLHDIGNCGLDLMPNINRPGMLETVKVYGYYCNLKYSINKNMFCSIGYSQVRCFPKGLTDLDDSYRYGQYMVGNLFWNFMNSAQAGVEILYGRRANMSQEKGESNRFNTMIRYYF